MGKTADNRRLVQVNNDRVVSVLVVEDDEVDREVIQRSFKSARLANPLIFAENGAVALQIMRGTHATQSINAPYVVLLDLNMPVMDGFELLHEMREDPDLRKIVVFVLSTSDDDRDICRAYDAGISGYILKTTVGQGFRDATEMLGQFWNIVILP